MKAETKREKMERLRLSLEMERKSFEAHWRDLSEHITPRRSRFIVSDVNKGDKRNQKIIDSTATMAARSLMAGMTSGITSPARPWFKLTVDDPNMAESYAVKSWLADVEKRIYSMFSRSNLYRALPVIYSDMGVYGTGAILVEEDFRHVMRFYPLAVGSYSIANDSSLRVNVFTRSFQMTVRQIVEEFGTDQNTGKVYFDNISDSVKQMWENEATEQQVTIHHLIYPNPDYNPRSPLAVQKKYLSCYYENGTASNGMIKEDLFLRCSGYDLFPVLVPRWEVTGEDVYGTSCPGMTALGDIKSLQLMQKRKSQAIDKIVNPPMTGPTSLINQKTSILPGDVTYVDSVGGQQAFRPSHEVNLRIGELVQDIQEHQKRISRAFYEDLFLMLANSDRREITAREIDERHEEKLLALGPVLEQLNQDLLDPLIDLAFDFMLKQNHLPQPPQELEGQNLKVEYVSIMAQAQKSLGIAGVERFAGFVHQMAAVNPEILDNIDNDEIATEYAEMLGVSVKFVRPFEEVQKIRQGRAQAAQQQAQAEQMQRMTQGAKNLSETPLGQGSALDEIIGAGGGGMPQ
jgi:Bacteriophage head to tail connecting protein